VPYRKSYSALIEDKGRYFDVNLEALRKCVRKADANEKRLYDLDNEGLTLFYTLITALEGNDS